MAINSTLLTTTSATTVYTSSNSTALTFLSLCNHSASAVDCNVHIVASGGSPTNSNILIQGIQILAGDTYILYSGGEKIILDDGDYVSVTALTGNAVTCITSNVEV